MALVKERQPYISERERLDGTVLEMRGVPLGDGGFITTYMDITERRRSQAKIVRLNAFTLQEAEDVLRHHQG